MDSKSRLMAFLDQFFLKLERFPPGEDVVTYDRIKVRFHHPAEGLNLAGAIALAKNLNSGHFRLRLVFELSETNSTAQAPVQVEIKHNFNIGQGPAAIHVARDEFKKSTLGMLNGFSNGGLRPSHFPAPVAVGQ